MIILVSPNSRRCVPSTVTRKRGGYSTYSELSQKRNTIVNNDTYDPFAVTNRDKYEEGMKPPNVTVVDFTYAYAIEFAEVYLHVSGSVKQSSETLELIISCVFFIVVAFDFFFNLYFLGILVYLRKTTTNTSFYLIVWQLTLSNVVAALSSFIRTFPLLFFDNSIYQEFMKYINTIEYRMLVFADNMTDQLVLYSVLLIAIHRFSILVIGERTKIFFTRNMYFVYLAIIWLLSSLFCYGTFIWRCSFKYDYTTLFFNYKCKDYLLAEPFFLHTAILTTFLVTAIALPMNWAYIVTKAVSTIELLAGALTPAFFIFSSREINKAAKRPFSSCCKKDVRKKTANANNKIFIADDAAQK